jgi:hypothetical protein
MVDWGISTPKLVDESVAKLKIAIEDLDSNPAISSADTADMIDQAARLINSAVVGGALVVPSAGGTGLLPAAAGALAPAAAPAAPAPVAPAIDLRLEAAASAAGLSVEEFLGQARDVILGLDNPGLRSTASRGARATAAASAAAGFIVLTECSEPPGSVLSDGKISSGPAPVLSPAPAAGSVSKADHDRVLARIAAFEAARTALATAKGMPQGNRRERADRDTAIQAAVAQLNAV